MLKKQERSADRPARPTVASRKRTKPLDFVREVRGELGRVTWPSRGEVLTYTVVVLVSVTFFMLIIGGLDYVFTKGIVKVISGGN
ncbi:MAG: preprotein translocase subunit SecE [Actinomycetota bacterium]